jgi:hypothetical protein
MAQAGYDPDAALGLWHRMEAEERQGPPEFLSTHPSYGTRVANIEGWLPEARSYLHGVPETGATLPPLESVERAGGPEHDLLGAIARVNRLAARQSGALLRAMAREFQMEPAAIVQLQRDVGLSPGELAVVLVLADEGPLTRAALTADLRSDADWAAIVRRHGASPAGVSRRLWRLAFAAG